MKITTSRFEPRVFTNTAPPSGYKEYELIKVPVTPQNTTGYAMKVHITTWGPYALYLQNQFDDKTNTYPCGYFDRIETADGTTQMADSVVLYHCNKTPNADFRKRKNAGEIIMSPYEHSLIAVNLVETSKFISDSFQYSDSNVFIRCPLNDVNDVTRKHGIKGEFKEYKNPGGDYGSGNFFKIGNSYCRIFSLGFVFNCYKVTRQTGLPSSLSCATLADDILAECKSRVIPDAFVQDVLVKANQGDIDALTTLAELPESVKSILNGFSLIAKITRDAKKGEFRLLASIPSRTKHIQHQLYRKWFEKMMKKQKFLDFATWKKRNWYKTNERTHTSYKDLYFAAKRKHEEEISRMLDNDLVKSRFYEKAQMKAHLEVTSAVAGVWLNYRYNIMPIVYTIEDALNTVEKWSRIYRRYSGPKLGLSEDSIVLPGFKDLHRQNVLIKRSYRKETLYKHTQRSMNFDVLVTAYELVPLWSIVLDWFFTIGPMLRAIQWNPTQDQDKSCSMFRSKGDGKFTKVVNGVEHTFDIQINYFRREIINPNRSIGIYFAPDLNVSRQLDSLAFTFNALKGGIQKAYR